jgi:signal transduction histidine kinase
LYINISTSARFKKLTNVLFFVRGNKITINKMIQHCSSLKSISPKQEKLIKLGTLAAGLAHEMNNPVAANCRAVDNLHEVIIRLSSLTLQLNKQMTPTQLELVFELQQQLIERVSINTELDALTYSDLEEDATVWLEAHSVPDGWKLAPTFVKAGLDTEWLSSIEEIFSTDLLRHVLNWSETILEVFGLLDEIMQSTGRISNLVQAVKAYSYMEQAPLREVDVHEGLNSTLTLLSHKLKQGVEVTRKYDQNLPHCFAHQSELNQVWTNIIDNAIEAMAGQGKIWICTSQEHDCILVEIIDNGPGILPNIQPHIFEPFFTTKDEGVGTGLGLDISRRIIDKTHHGSISFTSEPGKTHFKIRLPINLSSV